MRVTGKVRGRRGRCTREISCTMYYESIIFLMCSLECEWCDDTIRVDWHATEAIGSFSPSIFGCRFLDCK